MKTTKQKNNKVLIPIIFVLGFVPLIVHQYEYHTHLSVFEWFPDASEIVTDFFLAYKSFAILILGAVMLGILIYDYIHKKRLSFEPMCYPLVAYAALVLLSGLLSKYRTYAFRGGYEMFESVLVVLSYVMFCYYTYHYVQCEGQVRKVLHWSGIGIMAVTTIGVFQFYGKDLFLTTFGRKLITNPSWWNNLDELKFTFPVRTVYTTLYNVDFLPFYFGVLIPVLIGMFLAARRWWLRILYLIPAAAFAICLKGSGTDSWYLALPLALAVGVFILMSRKIWSMIAAIVVYALVLMVGVNAFMGTPAWERLRATVVGTVHWADSIFIKDIDTNADSVVFSLQDKKLQIAYAFDPEEGTYLLETKDGDENILSYTILEDESYKCVLDDEAYAGCSIQLVNLGDYYGIGVTIDGITWYFTNQTDGTYYYLNPLGKLAKMHDVPSVEWFCDDAFSGRGFIWNRTIPILKKYLFLGIGANNYVLAFPQNDYVIRVYRWGVATYDVKAHCWPMQQWVENGLIAMLCILGFYAWYFIRSVRIYRRAKLRRGAAWIGFGILIGTLNYMIASLANDSNVNTAPVFWIMMGLGMAVNRMVVQEQGLFQRISKPAAITAESKEEQSSARAAETSANAKGVSAAGTTQEEKASAAYKEDGRPQVSTQRKKNRKKNRGGR